MLLFYFLYKYHKRSSLVVVEEIKECLETKFLIQDTQQDIIENAIIALRSQ